MIGFARSWLGYPKYGLVCLPHNREQECDCVCTWVDMCGHVGKDPIYCDPTLEFSIYSILN
jgi:hypothetical protein